MTNDVSKLIFSDGFESALLSFVKNNYLPKRERGHKNRPFSNRDLSTFLLSIKLLHESFTKDGGSNLGPYFRYREARAAYFLAFYPLNIGKIITLFRESAVLELLCSEDNNKVIDILDFGAGPLTGTAGLLLAKPELAKRLRVTAVDREFDVMKDGRNLIQNYFPDVKNIYLEERIPKNRNYDLVIASHTLNEIRDFEKVAEKLLSVTKENGVVLFIEPATRYAANILMRVRESISKMKKWSIIYPCFHSEACPLLANPRYGWCHQVTQINLPPILRNIRSSARLDPADAKKSSLVIKHGGVKEKSKGKRVLSNPMKTPVESVVYICEPNIPIEVKVKEGSNLRPGSIL